MKNILNKVSKTLFGSLSAITLLMMTFPLKHLQNQKNYSGLFKLSKCSVGYKEFRPYSKEMPGVEVEHIKVGGGGDMLRAIAANKSILEV